MGEKNCPLEEGGGTRALKKEAPVLTLHRIPVKHLEGIQMWLLPFLVTVIMNTAAGCCCHWQALVLNAIISVPSFDKKRRTF